MIPREDMCNLLLKKPVHEVAADHWNGYNKGLHFRLVMKIVNLGFISKPAAELRVIEQLAQILRESFAGAPQLDVKSPLSDMGAKLQAWRLKERARELQQRMDSLDYLRKVRAADGKRTRKDCGFTVDKTAAYSAPAMAASAASASTMVTD